MKSRLHRSAFRVAVGLALYAFVVALQALLLIWIMKQVQDSLRLKIHTHESHVWVELTKDIRGIFAASVYIVVWNNIGSNFHKLVYSALELLAGDETQDS